MRKKRFVLTVAALVIFLAGLTWLLLRPSTQNREPLYQGKPLSAWLEVYDPANTNRSSQQLQATQRAIREMGSNCVPTLVHMLEQKDSPMKLRLIALAQKQSLVKIRHVPEPNRYERAAMGLEVLGPRAESAVPELVRIYDLDLSPNSQPTIARVLGVLGPIAKAAVPSLLRDASSTNLILKLNVIYALGKIHADPDRVVPVLIMALQDPNLSVMCSAAAGLQSFGPQAKSAVPALLKVIESFPPPPANSPYTGISVGGVAGQALRSIDPEAATKAGY